MFVMLCFVILYYVTSYHTIYTLIYLWTHVCEIQKRYVQKMHLMVQSANQGTFYSARQYAKSYMCIIILDRSIFHLDVIL